MLKDYRVLTLLGGVLMLLVLMSLVQGLIPEYIPFQKEYYRLAGMKEYDTGVNQNNIPTADGVLIDRCASCHMGANDESAVQYPAPLQTHPDILASAGGGKDPHNRFQIGCVVCHEGNGRGLTVHDAHGVAHDWTMPLLKGKQAQASCAKCHDTESQDLAGADLFNHGKALFFEKACWACHTIDGVSDGKKGPVLSDAGAKFTLKYLVESLVTPWANIATSTMPKFSWTSDTHSVEALAVYLKSQRLHKFRSTEKGPVEHPAPKRTWQDDPTVSVERGREIFQGQAAHGAIRGGCLNCHSYRDDQGLLSGGNQGPELTWVVRARSEEFIRQHLQDPVRDVPDTIMPRFDTLTPSETDSLLAFLGSLNFSSLATDGAGLFKDHCSSCHGETRNGKGRIYRLLDPLPRTLASRPFVLTYHERFKSYLQNGIPGTSMPAWGNVLSEQQIGQIIQYLRDEVSAGDPFERLAVKLPVAGDEERRSYDAEKKVLLAGDAQRGKQPFLKYCTGCHGKLANGKGPNAYFLEHPLPRNLINRPWMTHLQLTDERLYQSILLGVAGMPMPSHDHLPDQAILDAIHYLRSLNPALVKGEEQ